MKFKMGLGYRDVVTGFAGAMTGKASYITGCDQILLARPGKEAGEEGKSVWFDAGRLVEDVTVEKVVLPSHARHDNGADLAAPVK